MFTRCEEYERAQTQWGGARDIQIILLRLLRGRCRVRIAGAREEK